MTTKLTRHLKVSQQEPIPGRTDMIQNDAGGFVFEVDNLEKLRRFLILGTEGGTYYAGEHKLTLQNVSLIRNWLDTGFEAGKIIVDEIVRISDEGLAPKNDPAIFALALAASFGDAETRAYALKHVNAVCRTGTHIMQFVDCTEDMQALGGKGHGRSWRRAIGKWFTEKDIRTLTYQAIKYRQREGWTLKDLLRLSHPIPDSEHRPIFSWICGKGYKPGDVEYAVPAEENAQIYAFDLLNDADAMVARKPKGIADIIKNGKLPMEAIPTEYLKHIEVWDALLPNMPLTARIRNLGRLTANGFLVPLSTRVQAMVYSLTDANYIKKSRVHPFSLFVAMNTYASGQGLRGKLTWEPISQITSALEQAFWLSFKNVIPTNKRFLSAIDCSGSMGHEIELTHQPAYITAGILALIMAHVESCHAVYAFDDSVDTVTPVNIGPTSSIADARNALLDTLGGGTDIAAPIEYFTKDKIEADAIIIYTDNQTWAGWEHPIDAMKKYRKNVNPDAKLVVVAMCDNQYTVEPNSPFTLNVVGLDTNVPSIIAGFVGGYIPTQEE